MKRTRLLAIIIPAFFVLVMLAYAKAKSHSTPLPAHASTAKPISATNPALAAALRLPRPAPTPPDIEDVFGVGAGRNGGQGSLSLDGSGSYLRVPNSPSLDLTGPFTVDAWIRTNVTAQQGIVERYNWSSAADGGFALRLTDEGKVQLVTVRSDAENDSVTGGTILSIGDWHHVAGVFDGSELRIYIDGVLDGSKGSTLVPASGTADLIIGALADAGGGFFDGLIDEARITSGIRYAGNFTPEQQFNAGGLVLNPDGVATRGVWSFRDETATDESGNDNNGEPNSKLQYSTDVAEPPTIQTPQSVNATQVFLNFDEVFAGTVVDTLYLNQGKNVRFISNIPNAHVVTLHDPGLDFPHSPPNSILSGPEDGITVEFPRPVNNLKFWINDCNNFFDIANLDTYQGTTVRHWTVPGGGPTHPPLLQDFEMLNVQGITKVVVFNIRDFAGLSYDDFGYSVPDVTPTPPTNLVANIVNNQISLTWGGSQGATSYKVKRSTTSGGGYGLITTTSTTSFVDTTAAKGITYFYVVTAANSAGESGNSNQATAFIPNPRPDPPTNLSAVPDEQAITLFWDPIPGATSYVISRTNTPPPNGPNTPEAPVDTTFICSSTPCRFDDPNATGEPLNSDLTYTYEVGGLNSAGFGDRRSVSRKPLSTPGCRATPTPKPADGTVNNFGWRLNYTVTPNDGLVISEVYLENKRMAKQMSVPYFLLSRTTPSKPAIVTSRGELTPTEVGDSMRSRLTSYKINPPDADKILIEADYAIDRIPGATKACLNITQKFEFYRDGASPPEHTDPCEPSNSVPGCHRFRPMLEYSFHGNGAATLSALNTPMRLQFQNTVAKNTVALTRDFDRTADMISLEVPFQTVFNPLAKAWYSQVIVRRSMDPNKDAHQVDNFHQTNNKYAVELPGAKRWIPNPLTGGQIPTKIDRAGCRECVHMHWRWSSLIPFGKFGHGAPLVPADSDQTVDIMVARFTNTFPDFDPEDYYHTLFKSNQLLRSTSREDDEPREVVFWFSPTGFGDHDTFFWYPAWFTPALFENPPDPAFPSENSPNTADGPVSVVFGNIYEQGLPTFDSYDLSLMPPLPPGYAPLTSAGHLIGTTGVVSGPHRVNFSAASVTDQTSFNNLRIFYAKPDPFDPEKPVWVDATILPPDTPAPNFSAKTLSARTENLGVFLIGKQVQPIPNPGVANLRISSTDSADPITAGNNLTYNITLTNDGPQTATGVALKDQLSADVTVVSATPSQGTCKTLEAGVYCSLNSLAVGSSATLALVVKPIERTTTFPAEGKMIANTVIVRSRENDDNPDNDWVTEETTVLPSSNKMPQLRIVSPSTGARYIGPLNVTINAVATDIDGTISDVKFLDNGELIGTGTPGSGNTYSVVATISPTCHPTPAHNQPLHPTHQGDQPCGIHSLTAVATDNGGRQNISAPIDVIVNGAATVNITGPATGSIMTPGSITLSASASHPSHPISEVEFFANTLSLGHATPVGANQYNLNWANVPAGVYSVVAVATDDSEIQSWSTAINLTVGSPPTVTITNPSEGTVFPLLTNISVNATAHSSFGSIVSVEFFANGNLIGTSREVGTDNYMITWRQLPQGLYSLTAIATDSLGLRAQSQSLTIGVNMQTPDPGDFIWFDEAAPEGAALFGNRDGWYWVDSNPASFSGAKHHQSQIARGFHEHGFESAGFKLPVNADDKLYTYVFLSPGFKPQELMLAWRDQTGSWEHRAYWSDRTEGNWISNYGVDGTVSRRRMGPLPAEGGWVRLEIPAADVGLAGKTAIGMSFITYGGRAAFDRTGKSNRPTPTPQPPADVPYFDDALPQGAVEENFHDTWRFITSNPAPIAGSKAHQSFIGTSGDNNKYRAHGFKNATQTMTVDPGDTLYTYVYMDPNVKPDELVVGWHDGTDWHRAYWGSSWVLAGGRWGTEGMRFMGGLPQAGEWVRLEVPAAYVGLEGKRVSGMYFGMNRDATHGLVTWDVTGKSTVPVSTSFQPLFATVPIHQFYNNDEGYTYFVSERQRSGAPAMNRWYVHTNQAPGTNPIYRMRNSDSHHFILTPNPGLAGPGWSIDPSAGDGGVPFYIYPNAGTPETTPLHSYRRGQSHDYYYTIDPNDLAIDGRHYEGPIGWVHPTRSVMSPQANLIDDAKFFVQQHYSDFLSREPDNSGLAFWTGQYNICAPYDLPCIDDKRNNISAAFFLSIEFQETGYFVYRYRKASFNEMPRRQQLYDDKAIVGAGVVVGNPGWENVLAANKATFSADWVGRPEFGATFNNLSNTEYVDRLYANAGITPEPQTRTSFISGLDANTLTRASVLRSVVDTEAFVAKEYNKAFVLTEYFGYLQRNPDDPPNHDLSGFYFWLNKLNEHNGNYLDAEMVKSFLVSGEYRGRFGPPAGPNSAALLTVGSNISAKVGNLDGKFATVSSAGLMEVKALYPWSVDEPPAGYTFFKNLAWKVTSTSNTSPPYTLTANIPWEVADAADFAKLRIFSREGNAWVDRTILAPDSPAPDFNGRTLSARVNTLSTVIVAHEGDTQTSLSITSPSNGATFNAPASISINTSSYDPDGVIDKVQFYNGNELIGEDTTVPYNLNWTNVNAGTYAITVRALDNMGVNIASANVNVVVNGPPIVVIMAPVAGTSFETPANIAVEVYASSSTGITKVEFFQGTTKLGEDTTAPYTFNWNSVGLGSYNLTAKATNNANLTATSSIATITVVNTPPTVSITSPANGANLGNAPANVVITAAAADSHGVKNVEFFKNGVSLGIDTTAPYSFSWNNVPTGTFNLTAKVTDNLDAVTISAPVSVTVTNTPPSVSITAPAPNTAYTAPASITINATATDNEGVSKVEFFQNSTKLGEDTTAPYSFTWTNAGSGTYSLTARATDGQNETTTSSAVNVTVNAPPAITLTSPANGATYIAPAGVVLEASASDTDGTITQVEFFQNNASIGSDTSPPYSMSWAHVPFGSYSLTARATDDRGATVTSNVVNITVNPASTVLITSPNNNAVFIGGATVAFSANATDSDGISKVEFFQGSTKLGEDTSAPYSYDWTDVAAGDYSLTARATDNLGEITNSAVMSISVLAQVKQFVGWSSVTNGLDLGNGSVRKTSTGTWDFSANSLQKLLAGDAYFESTAANYNQSIGLAGSDGAVRALVIGSGGWAAIYENGQEVASTCCRIPSEIISPHAAGDRYRIEITNSVLRYVRYRAAAREVMFTSAAALPAYPISLGLGISPQDAEWQKTVLAQLTRKVTWSAIVNGVDLGNGSVRKTSTGAWDFSATAKQTLLRGDGYFESTASYWNHSMNVGGANGAGGSLVVGTGGWAAIYENGQEVANTSPLGNISPHLSGDRYRVEITSGVLRYVRYRSGVRAVLYTSTNPLPAYPLSFSLGASFQNSEWQDTVMAQLSQTVSWSYINNGIDLGSGSVRKTSTGAWDFSAGPRQQLVSGNGYFESTASYWNHSINIGGSNNAGGSLVAGTGGWAAIYENGLEVANTSPLGNIAPHASGDRYRLEISRGKLRYVRYRASARSIMFTSANALPAYAASYNLGASFQNSEWQNSVFSDNVPEHNNASFVSQSVPATMAPGQTYSVTVTMRNTGASTWTPDGDYQLASENQPDNQRWGINRVNLDSIVLPGADGTFSFTVTAPATGTHSFQWRMIQQGVESFGALTTNVNVQTSGSAPAPFSDNSTSTSDPNAAPFVAITSPGNGASFLAPATISLEASAYDTDGTVTEVEFFQDGKSLGVDKSAPYSLSWTDVTEGTYSLTARARDDRGAIMTSDRVTIVVGATPFSMLMKNHQSSSNLQESGVSNRPNQRLQARVSRSPGTQVEKLLRSRAAASPR